MDVEVQFAVLHGFARVDSPAGAVRLPPSRVPDDDIAATVLAGRDDAFEVHVFQRVILDVERRPAYIGIQSGSLRDCPADQHAVHFQPEVVVQPACAVPLDNEPSDIRLGPGDGGARRLRRPGEIPFAPVSLQGLRFRLNRGACRIVGHGPIPSPAAVGCRRRRLVSTQFHRNCHADRSQSRPFARLARHSSESVRPRPPW